MLDVSVTISSSSSSPLPDPDPDSTTSDVRDTDGVVLVMGVAADVVAVAVRMLLLLLLLLEVCVETVVPVLEELDAVVVVRGAVVGAAVVVEVRSGGRLVVGSKIVLHSPVGSHMPHVHGQIYCSSSPPTILHTAGVREGCWQLKSRSKHASVVPGLMLAIAVVGSGDVEGSGVGVLVLSA